MAVSLHTDFEENQQQICSNGLQIQVLWTDNRQNASCRTIAVLALLQSSCRQKWCFHRSTSTGKPLTFLGLCTLEDGELDHKSNLQKFFSMVLSVQWIVWSELAHLNCPSAQIRLNPAFYQVRNATVVSSSPSRAHYTGFLMQGAALGKHNVREGILSVRLYCQLELEVEKQNT